MGEGKCPLRNAKKKCGKKKSKRYDGEKGRRKDRS